MVILLSALLTSCGDRALQAPAMKAAALVGSVNATAELLEESTGNVFSLTIESANISADYTPEQITSVCALAFYNELNEK